MAIDTESVGQVGVELVEDLLPRLDGYGDHANVLGLVLVARVRLEPTDEYPVDTGQTIVCFNIATNKPDVTDDERRAYLVTMLEDALKEASAPHVDPDDLPSL